MNETYSRRKEPRMKRRSLAVLFAALLSTAAAAAPAPQISDGVVKIGLLLDMTSLYADITGEGTVAAVKISGLASSNSNRIKPFTDWRSGDSRSPACRALPLV